MIKLGNLVNEESLTIFTDASISPNRDGTYYGCPGFVAVDANGIIDSGYIVIDNTTSNNSEIKAIRMGVMAANKLTNYRIEQLEKKVDKHNTVIERTFKLEEAQAVLTEQIKVANHRIEDLEKEN